jgi:hypothetical protein
MSGGRDEVAPAGSVIPVWLDGTDGVSEGGRLVLGRRASGVLVGRGNRPLLVDLLPPEPLLLEVPLMDPDVPAAGEVKIGAVDEAAGEGVCGGGDVAGTTGGAWVAPGMVSDHPG